MCFFSNPAVLRPSKHQIVSKKYFIIDFDSTFTQVEALDELARISLQDRPDREAIYRKIEEYTNKAMEGKLSFRESLAARVQLLEADKSHLKLLVKHLKKLVSTSFARNKNFFRQHANEVLIVSGGFKEFITPVVLPFHIKPENIYANTFVFDKNGKIVGYDDTNPLSYEGGKVKLLQTLKLPGEIHGIGDGYSDFQLKESGMIKKFYAFTENIERKSVTEKADHVTPSLDEILYINKIPAAISYPKNRIVCLVAGNVPEETVKFLKKDGFAVKHTATLDKSSITEAGILLLGKGQTLTTELLSDARKLKVIGYSAEVNIPLALSTERGIAVFAQGKKPESLGKRIAGFINNGDTVKSENFPHIQLPSVSGHRFIHIHKNMVGVLAKVNQVFAAHELNVTAQYLMTNEQIGYVITDISGQYDKQMLKEMKSIPGTIQLRFLY